MQIAQFRGFSIFIFRQPSPQSVLEHFYHPPTHLKIYPISSHFPSHYFISPPYPSALGNHGLLSVSIDYGFAYLEHFI